MRMLPFAAILSMSAGAALAGPLDKKTVPADVTWVLHVDVEAALSSTIGKFILEHRDEADFKDLDDLKAKFGVDPITDVRGVTIFGIHDEGEDAVLLIDGTAAFDNVLQQMTAEKKIVIEDTDGYALLVWEEDGKSNVGYIRKGNKPESRLVYVSSDRDRLITALRTIDHKAASVADDPNTLLKASPAPGSFLFIDAPEIAGVLKKNGLGSKMKDHGHDQSALLETIRGVNLDAGEATRKLFVSVVVTADTPENALNMVQTAQGFAALGRLMMSKEPDFKEAVSLLNAVKISADDRRALLKASWSTETIQRLLESAEDHKHDDDADDDDGDQKPGKAKDPAPKKKSEGI